MQQSPISTWRAQENQPFKWCVFPVGVCRGVVGCSQRAGNEGTAWDTPTLMYHIFEPSLFLERFCIYFYFFMVLCVPLFILSIYTIHIEDKYSMFYVLFCVTVASHLARYLNIIQILKLGYLKMMIQRAF